MSSWELRYDSYDPTDEGLREALCTLGNGYFATRGAAPETSADDTHYPGTYAAGLFNRLSEEVSGRVIDNESLVNLPNWLPLTFRIEGGPWFDIDAVELLEYTQRLDLRSAVLVRRLRFRDGQGRTTSVAQRRIVSMRNPHVGALETTILAEDWSGQLEIRSAIDAGVKNSLVPRYRALASVHLDLLGTSCAHGNSGRRRPDHDVTCARGRGRRTTIHSNGDDVGPRASASSRGTGSAMTSASAPRRANRSPWRRWYPSSPAGTPPSNPRRARHAA